MPLFISFEYVGRTAIAGSDGNPVTHFLGNHRIVFHSGRAILNSHQQCMRVSTSPLIFYFFLPITAILVIVKLH